MRIRNRLLLVATMFSMVGLVLATDAKDEKDLKDIAPYKSWTRVNPTPIEVKYDLGSIGG